MQILLFLEVSTLWGGVKGIFFWVSHGRPGVENNLGIDATQGQARIVPQVPDLFVLARR